MQVGIDAPMRPPLRFHGGKWRIAPWIISFFMHHVCYVEPFGGGASVLLRKPPAYLEVYNDIDEEVINFFDVLRERSGELINAIQLTPFSRSELARAYETSPDSFERARRFYIRSWQGRGGPRTQWKSGWRFQKTNTRGKRALDDFNETSHLWNVVERLKHVQIENDNAMKIIKRYDTSETLFYLDPPYLPDTRSERWGRKAYAFEMTEADHIELAECLWAIKGMAIISGYPSSLYDGLYSGWRRVECATTNGNNSSATEVLWISPQRETLPLFHT